MQLGMFIPSRQQAMHPPHSDQLSSSNVLCSTSPYTRLPSHVFRLKGRNIHAKTWTWTCLCPNPQRNIHNNHFPSTLNADLWYLFSPFNGCVAVQTVLVWPSWFIFEVLCQERLHLYLFPLSSWTLVDKALITKNKWECLCGSLGALQWDTTVYQKCISWSRRAPNITTLLFKDSFLLMTADKDKYCTVHWAPCDNNKWYTYAAELTLMSQVRTESSPWFHSYIKSITFELVVAYRGYLLAQHEHCLVKWVHWPSFIEWFFFCQLMTLTTADEVCQ